MLRPQFAAPLPWPLSVRRRPQRSTAVALPPLWQVSSRAAQAAGQERKPTDGTAAAAPTDATRPRLASRLLLRGVTNARHNLAVSQTLNTEFYTESKWCESCKTYVPFLMSVNHSYCVHCGGRVRLFSRDDSTNFGETVQRHKWQAS